jgi:hypothetical protein
MSIEVELDIDNSRVVKIDNLAYIDNVDQILEICKDQFKNCFI